MSLRRIPCQRYSELCVLLQPGNRIFPQFSSEFENLVVFILLGLFCTVALGCSVSPPKDLVPATGQFVWEDGSPLEGIPGIARLQRFDPSRPQAETAAEQIDQTIVARLIQDGRFKVETSLMAGKKTHNFPGLPPGQYKIMLFLKPADQGTPRINPDYEHPVRTPLKIDVQKGEKNHFELTVERHLNGWQP